MMRNIYLAALSVLLLSTTANAQLDQADNLKKSLSSKNVDTVAWIHEYMINVGVNEGFLHNWSAGGELAALTVNGMFRGDLTHFDHNKIWSNHLELSYALYYAYSNSFIPHKTDDRIDYTSKYNIKIDDSKGFYFSGLFNFRSQFSKGYDYSLPKWDTASTSKFMSPAYFTLAAGVDYRKGDNLSLFFSPIAARVTLADKYYTLRDPAGAFGVAYGKTSRFELGAYFSGRYTVKINDLITYQTRLDLYSNYLAKDQKDSLGNVVKKDNPGNIDWLWDNLIMWKMSKHFNFTLAATFVYDNDFPYSKTYVDQSGNTVKKDEPAQNLGWWQLKQVFTLGLVYKF